MPQLALRPCRHSIPQGLEFFPWESTEAGLKSIHLTKRGACDMGKALAQAYIDSGLMAAGGSRGEFEGGCTDLVAEVADECTQQSNDAGLLML
jgi:hypothetical protein